MILHNIVRIGQHEHSIFVHFDHQFHLHFKHFKLKGLQPNPIDTYARAIRRLGRYFSDQIDALSETQLTEYFSDLIGTHSWSAVKLALYGFKFYTAHVLKKPWVMLPCASCKDGSRRLSGGAA